MSRDDALLSPSPMDLGTMQESPDRLLVGVYSTAMEIKNCALDVSQLERVEESLIYHRVLPKRHRTFAASSISLATPDPFNTSNLTCNLKDR